MTLTWSQSFKQSFLAGLLALLPIFITWKVLALLFAMVDGPLGARINGLVSHFAQTPVHIPGLGILCTALIVLAIGWLTRLIFFRRMLEAVEQLIDRVPLVRSLYNASRQIVVPFADSSKIPFSQVVMAEYPMPGRWTLGLVAQEQEAAGGGRSELMVVFFPSNHLHLGYPVVLPRKDVVKVDMSIEEAIKFFVSCGVVGGDNLIPTLEARKAPPEPPRLVREA
jgi:uncharacterized membrane protein